MLFNVALWSLITLLAISLCPCFTRQFTLWAWGRQGPYLTGPGTVLIQHSAWPGEGLR